jgi:hypothetical protein
MGRPSKYSPGFVSAQSAWCRSTPRSMDRSGGDPIGRREIGLRRRSAAPLGATGRARCRPATGLTTDERARLKQLERENFELRRANEILKKASAYFAQAELDRRAK